MLFILRLAIVALALAAAWLPLPASLVERAYSSGLYPVWQRAVTAASNRVPFALFDILILLAVVRVLLLVGRLVRPGRAPWALAALGPVVRLAAFVAIVYLVFLASWGLNYRRTPLASRLDHAEERVTPEAAASLARRLSAGANRLHADAHRAARPSWEGVAAELVTPFAAVQQQVTGGGATLARPGRPKWSALTYYFERAGVDGMTDPFLLEVLVNQGLLPFERSAVLAHEWAHLAGFADESEANVVGWLVCLQGPRSAQYSAHLAILGDLLGSLPASDRDRVARGLDAGPRADLEAVAARVAKTSPALRQASWRVYDRYLKANRVEAGVRSYGAALQLLLGTRMAPGWKPVLRPRAGARAGDGTT